MWLIDMGASPSLASGSPCSAVGFVKNQQHRMGIVLTLCSSVQQHNDADCHRRRWHAVPRGRGAVPMRLGLRLPQRMGIDLRHDVTEVASAAERARVRQYLGLGATVVSCGAP